MSNSRPIKPDPVPYLPEIEGLVDVVAPCDGYLTNIEEVISRYQEYKGMGVGITPDNPELFSVINGDLYKDVSKHGADVFVFKNPTFKSSVFIQAGLFNNEFDSTPDEFPFPEDPSDPRVSRVGKGDHFHTMDLEKLGKLKMTTMCVVIANKDDLEKIMQKVELSKDIFAGKQVKEGEFLFTFKSVKNI